MRCRGVLEDLGPDVQASLQKVICTGEGGPLLSTPGESEVSVCASVCICVKGRHGKRGIDGNSTHACCLVPPGGQGYKTKPKDLLSWNTIALPWLHHGVKEQGDLPSPLARGSRGATVSWALWQHWNRSSWGRDAASSQGPRQQGQP